MPILVFNPQMRELPAEVAELVEKYKNLKEDVIVTVGGDGSILGAEARYPGVPILPLRVSKICRMCANGDARTLIEAVVKKEISPNAFMKLEARVGKKKLTVLNEFNIRAGDPRGALRFSFREDEAVIGDGVVVATPFGATGYFENIARTVFEIGIGVVYNNSNLGPKTRILKEDSEVVIRIDRGPGGLYADNNPEWIELKSGDEIVITRCRKPALIFGGP